MPDTNYISEYVIEELDGQMRPMTYLKATVEVPESRLMEIDHYLNDEPASADDCLSEDDTIIYTARFADGYEMDIKCCGVQFHDGPDETNTAWCEAVLFNPNGNEVANEIGDYTLRGTWTLEHDGTTYIARIVPVIVKIS